MASQKVETKTSSKSPAPKVSTSKSPGIQSKKTQTIERAKEQDEKAKHTLDFIKGDN